MTWEAKTDQIPNPVREPPKVYRTETRRHDWLDWFIAGELALIAGGVATLILRALLGAG